jgi:predicted dienelactone hydrolase
MESFLRHILYLAFIAALFAGPAVQAGSVGFKDIELPDPAGRRPLHVSMWYPTNDRGPQVNVGENRAFVGLSVVRAAEIEAGPHPLVLLSHGFGGTWRNLNWLAGELARHGYVVAAPDHPGTTFFDRRPEEATRLWERPRDLSRVLDALTADAKLLGAIDTRRIVAIGHSLGGWTVLELAGGRLDARRLTQDCDPADARIKCKLFVELGIGTEAGNTSELGRDLSDLRLDAVVSLDLGLATGLTPESLAAIRLPVLVIAASEDFDRETAAKAEVAATRTDSALISKHLPPDTSSYREIPGAFHFSFLQICKAGAFEIIEEETPGEGIVCGDGEGYSRSAIHRQIIDSIIEFLTMALPVQ